MSAEASRRAKRTLRRVMRDRGARRTPDAARRAGEAVVERLVSAPAWSEVRTLALFVGRGDEVDTRPLIERAIDPGVLVLAPRVEDEGARSMVFRALAGWDALEAGAFGLLEPSDSAPPHALSEADWVLVPGLAFDRHGGRLGRGAGYYDRALAAGPEGPSVAEHRSAARLRLIGVGHDDQLVDAVPMGPLDVRLDAVVTDRGWYVAARSARPGPDDGPPGPLAASRLGKE